MASRAASAYNAGRPGAAPAPAPAPLALFLGNNVDLANMVSSKVIAWPEYAKRQMNAFTSQHQLSAKAFPTSEQLADFLGDNGIADALYSGVPRAKVEVVTEKIIRWIQYNARVRIPYAYTQSGQAGAPVAVWPMWTTAWLDEDWDGDTRQPEDADSAPRPRCTVEPEGLSLAKLGVRAVDQLLQRRRNEESRRPAESASPRPAPVRANALPAQHPCGRSAMPASPATVARVPPHAHHPSGRLAPSPPPTAPGASSSARATCAAPPPTQTATDQEQEGGCEEGLRAKEAGNSRDAEAHEGEAHDPQPKPHADQEAVQVQTRVREADHQTVSSRVEAGGRPLPQILDSERLPSVFRDAHVSHSAPGLGVTHGRVQSGQGGTEQTSREDSTVAHESNNVYNNNGDGPHDPPLTPPVSLPVSPHDTPSRRVRKPAVAMPVRDSPLRRRAAPPVSFGGRRTTPGGPMLSAPMTAENLAPPWQKRDARPWQHHNNVEQSSLRLHQAIRVVARNSALQASIARAMTNCVVAMDHLIAAGWHDSDAFDAVHAVSNELTGAMYGAAVFDE